MSSFLVQKRLNAEFLDRFQYLEPLRRQVQRDFSELLT